MITLTRKNWTKGSFRMDEMCLILACENDLEADRIRAIASALFPERAGSSHNAVNVNDHPDTVFEDVEKIQHSYFLEYGK